MLRMRRPAGEIFLLQVSVEILVQSPIGEFLNRPYTFRSQLIRKQNELLTYLKKSSQQELEEQSPKPDSVKDIEEEAECTEELYEDNAEIEDKEIDGSDFEMETIGGDSEEEFEAEESDGTAHTGVSRSDDIEYSDQQPKLVLTSNFLKAREAIKQNTSKDSSVPLKYLPVTLITSTEEKSVYICSQCNIEFSSELEAKMHLGDHKLIQPCEFCQKVFTTRRNYEKHIEKMHNNMKYECQVCGKVFDSKIQHRGHLRNHNQEKNHSCPFAGCAKAFRVKHHLNNHLRVHTKDSPYQCSFEGCSAKFRQKHALTIHLRKHNGDFYHCQQCKSPFVTQFQLNKHSKTCNGTYKPLVTRTPRSETVRTESRDFSCPIEDCSEIYKSKASLELHLTQSHQVEDGSALCNFCCKVFESDPALKSHHCASFQATCSICNDCFKDEESLSNHILEYHETDEL